jgi:hypothetical protein
MLILNENKNVREIHFAEKDLSASILSQSKPRKGEVKK